MKEFLANGLLLYFFLGVLCWLHGFIRVGFPQLKRNNSDILHVFCVAVLTFGLYLVIWPTFVDEVINDFRGPQL